MSSLTATLQQALIAELPGTLFVASGWKPGSSILWTRNELAASPIVEVREGGTVPSTLFDLDPSHRQVVQTHLEADGAVRDLIVAFQPAAAGVRWGRLTIAPIHADGESYVFFQIVDLRSQAELAERSNENAHLLGALDALQQQKSRLISVFSHDLRNPLTVILGNAQLIEADDTTDDVRESAEDIHSAAERMREIIDTLVLTRKLEDPELTIEPTIVDLSDLAAKRVRHFRGDADKKGIEILLRETAPVEVATDAALLSVVLDAFLSNAIKFSNPGGRAQVTIDATAERVRIACADDGPGLSPDDLGRAFDKFSKLTPQPTADEGCLGLGLYLGERAARALGGRVGAESDGNGSNFFIDLPR